MQRGLKDADVQNSLTQCDWSRMGGDGVADDFGCELARDLGLDLSLLRATKEQYDRMIAEDLGSHSKTATNIRQSRLVHAQSAKTHALLSRRRECDRNARAERQLSIANHSRRPQLYFSTLPSREFIKDLVVSRSTCPPRLKKRLSARLGNRCPGVV